MANYSVSNNGDINPIFPVGSNIGNWPQGGTAPSLTSTSPATSGADAANYWLPIWSGEVINAYDQYNIFEPLVTTETIESGTTKRFPVTGTVGHIGIWNAGDELIGGTANTDNPGWFDISLDQRPMASFFELDDIHLMLTQWDYRSELARQAGLKLSYIRDKQIACMIAKGAFTQNRAPFSSNYSGMNYGSNPVLAPNSTFNLLGNRLATAAQRSDAALLLLDYIERYMVKLSEIDATMGEVYCAVTPQAFHDIRALGIARDSNSLLGGAGRPFFGGVAEAGGLGAPLTQNLFAITEALDYMGVKIIKSNHLAELDQTLVLSGATAVAATGLDVTQGSATLGQYSNTDTVQVIGDLGDAKYNFNWHGYMGSNNDNPTEVVQITSNGVVATGDVFKPVKALIWQKSAVCSLRLQGMKVESVKDVRRGTYFTVSSIMAGAGILRPELCGAIQGSYTAA